MNDLYRFGICDGNDAYDIHQAIQAFISDTTPKRDDINNNINMSNECIVCMDNVRDLCGVCKDELVDGKCPVCRQKYDSVVKIFQ